MPMSMKVRTELSDAAEELGFRLERWRSDNNLEELHFYVERTKNPEDGPIYVAGFNPDLWSDLEIIALLETAMLSLISHPQT